MSRDRDRLRTAILVSGALHAVGIGLVWALSGSGDALPPMRVYAVSIVSPPPQEAGDWSPEPPAPVTPEPEPEEPEPEPEPEEPEPEPEPLPEPEPAPRQVAQAEPPRPAPPPPPQPRPAPAPASTGARPDPTSTGGENLNLELRGVQCPTPGYCENIVSQIHRYFRTPGGATAAEAEVFFRINRDGSVTDLRVISSTGGAAFRLAVMEAVEQAGRNRAFGPLPNPFRGDQLPVIFTFSPAR